MAKRARNVPGNRARFRPHAGFIAVSALFAAVFVALVLSAFHAPSPHGLPVGIVAPATVTGQVEESLASAAPGAFDLRVYDSEAAARSGIAHLEVDGALIDSDGRPRLLVARAAGAAPAQALTTAFDELAAHTGKSLAVTDVAPPLPDDTMALSPFFVVLGVLFPSMAAGSASALAFRRARPAWSVAAPVVAAIGGGLVAAGIADGIAGLGHFPVIAGIVALFALAVAAPTAALARIWPPLVAAAVLALIVFGIPASGGPSGLAAFGPGFLRVLHPALPLGVAASAVRSAVYFHGYGSAGPLWVLAAWALAGVAALTLVTIKRHAAHRAAAPVVQGPVVQGPVVQGPVVQGPVVQGPVVHEPVIEQPLLRVPAFQEGATQSYADSGEPFAASDIVAGFDNSGPARRALGQAARLATARHGTLHIVYADHPIIDSDLSGFGHAEMEAARDNEAAAVAEAAADIAAKEGVTYTFGRYQDTPADAILSAANALVTEDNSGPVIVVGRSGHGARHLLGSVPTHLLHHSPYPVLSIP